MTDELFKEKKLREEKKLLKYTLTCVKLGINHGTCRLTDGGNWDMRQNVRMEAIGNSAFGDKRGGISYRVNGNKAVEP